MLLLLTETGSSIRAHKLRIVDTICESTTQFIASKKAIKDPWKKKKMEQIAMLLRGAIAANNMVGLKMNIEEKNLAKVLNILTAVKNPTISQLSNKKWLAVETVIDEGTVRMLLPKLKNVGAQGIIEYPLNKLIYEQKGSFMPCGKKRKSRKIATHKRKKLRKSLRHLKKRKTR